MNNDLLYRNYLDQHREWQEVCGQDPEEDYVDRLMAEFDAEDITPDRVRLPQLQTRLFKEGEAA